MKNLLFVFGGGIGNIIQALPAIYAAAIEGYTIDLKLHCNSTNDLEIFDIPVVRNLFIKEEPKLNYDC